MDSGTGLTILGTAIGSAKVVENILGPTADYIGEGLQNWTQQRVENVGRIFRKAQSKLGERVDKSGSVPPKVLKGILDEGAFSDDELAAEYFGGVLASSRTEVGRDDRGVTFTALLSRLSTYQIRTHFFFYTVLKEIYSGADCNIGDPSGRKQLKTFIPFESYITAMEFSEGEDVGNILNHVLFGLDRESLIENTFSFGNVDHIKKQFEEADRPGILFSPSALGVELYFWAHGRGDLALNTLLDSSLTLLADVKVATTPGIRSVNFPDRGLTTPSQDVM